MLHYFSVKTGYYYKFINVKKVWQGIGKKNRPMNYIQESKYKAMNIWIFGIWQRYGHFFIWMALIYGTGKLAKYEDYKKLYVYSTPLKDLKFRWIKHEWRLYSQYENLGAYLYSTSGVNNVFLMSLKQTSWGAFN